MNDHASTFQWSWSDRTARLDLAVGIVLDGCRERAAVRQ